MRQRRDAGNGPFPAPSYLDKVPATMAAWRVLVSAIAGACAGWLAWFLYESWGSVTTGELVGVSIGAVAGVVLALALTVRASS